MNRLIRAAIPAIAAASSLVGCGTAPEIKGSGEVITCVGPWQTENIGSTLVFNAVTVEGGIADKMGVRSSDYLGFIATGLNKANVLSDGDLSFPTGCTVEHGVTSSGFMEARDEASAAGKFYMQDQDQNSGANLLLIAPTFNPNGKIVA